MDKQLVLVESREQEIELDAAQVRTLEALGRSLASSRSWWGSADSRGSSSASVVGVVSLGGCRWKVCFRNVVGALRLPGLHISVIPKIPQAHFFYLLARSSIAPRIGQEKASVSAGDEFANLLATWFVEAAEVLLRRSLRRDYEEQVGDLTEVRGRIEPLATAFHTLSGRPLVHCVYDELVEDSPLNRVVKGAASFVSSLTLVHRDLRDRARKIVSRMPTVGSLNAADLGVVPDRLTRHYQEVHPLARVLLDGGGLSTALGSLHGTAFLIRTPELVEDGLRQALSDAMPQERIKKRSLSLGSSGLTINPDLVFEGRSAVGDVKYQKLSPDWDRPSFNQAVTFATGFSVRKCAVIGFTDRPNLRLPRTAQVGAVSVRALAWCADASLEPHASLASLSADVQQWLAGNAA